MYDFVEMETDQTADEDEVDQLDIFNIDVRPNAIVDLKASSDMSYRIVDDRTEAVDILDKIEDR